MKYAELTREDMCRVIEGRGNAGRVPVLFHFWLSPETFGHEAGRVQKLMDEYPHDVQVMTLRVPDVYEAPADEPGYRWSYMDRPTGKEALDDSGFMEEWDEQADAFFADFPSADYPALIPEAPGDDGRYRLCVFWHFLFERFWTVRGMENALMDFYLYPDRVHQLFRKLTDFYKRMLERAFDELQPDGVFTSDDLGMQTGPFFSNEIFDAFFTPYYKEVIDFVHAAGKHFWLHICGNVSPLLQRFIDLGVDVIHPIQKYCMDEGETAGQCGGRITVWAGFDVQRTIPYGTPEDVRREVRYLVDTYTRRDGRFMLTFGNQITGDTPIESLEAVYDEAFAYGTERVAQLDADR